MQLVDTLELDQLYVPYNNEVFEISDEGEVNISSKCISAMNYFAY